ncbi:MAG TPA: chemotaxis protein CheW [Nitrospiria bacterium]|nr:chemotaxis protein CheW [Nitrospiria bacterium]
MAAPATSPALDSLPAESGRRVEEFLGFRLDNEEYAVRIRSVREIIRPTEITPIPRSPADILGIISLRGTIVPIFDLRRRLGLPRRESDHKSRIVVIVIDGAPVGMVVDQVTEVIMADPEGLEPPPTTMGEQEASFVTATLRHRERLLGVLHLERLVAIEPVTPLRAVA